MSHKLASLEVSQLLNSAVKGRNGEVLGHIRDIALNAGDGRVEYVTLTVNADEHTAEKSVAIPWSQFRLVNVAADIELNISREVLRMCAVRTP